MKIRIAGRDYPPVLTVPQAAAILGQHRSSTYADVTADRFPVPAALLTPYRSRTGIATVPLAEGLHLAYELVDETATPATG